MDPITMKLVADDLIRSALREDITYEDVSTVSVCPEPAPATVELIAKAAGVIAGLDVFERTFQLLDPATRVERLVKDGDEVAPGQVLAHVAGDARVLLSGERVALNYLQRMRVSPRSRVAWHVRSRVRAPSSWTRARRARTCASSRRRLCAWAAVPTIATTCPRRSC